MIMYKPSASHTRRATAPCHSLLPLPVHVHSPHCLVDSPGCPVTTSQFTHTQNPAPQLRDRGEGPRQEPCCSRRCSRNRRRSPVRSRGRRRCCCCPDTPPPSSYAGSPSPTPRFDPRARTTSRPPGRRPPACPTRRRRSCPCACQRRFCQRRWRPMAVLAAVADANR
jgi:hypothetical protein